MGTPFDLDLGVGERAKIELRWTGDTDLDLHAVVCRGKPGSPAYLQGPLDILSAYNVLRVMGDEEIGILQPAADRSFSILNGALTHGPDPRQFPVGEACEWLDFTTSGWNPASRVVIELIAMIHPQLSTLTFKDVGDVKFAITRTTGEVLLQSSLDRSFDDCFGVRLGAVVIEPGAAPRFQSNGLPLLDDFNRTLELFAERPTPTTPG